MAKLIKCKHCGAEVSKKAPICPQCGGPLKRKPIGCGTLVVVIFAAAIWASIFNGSHNTGSTAPAKPAIPTTKEDKAQLEAKLLAELKTIPASEFGENLERYKKLLTMFPANQKYKDKVKHYQAKADRQALINKQFSAWDGSHRQLERYIKKNLKNPDSYEHVETRYFDQGDHIIIKTKYRATNSFNALILETASARASIDGMKVTILSQ